MRDIRFRFVGALFYATLLGSLLCTHRGLEALSNLSDNVDVYQVLFAALGFGALVFTSEAGGYLFNTGALFFWNFGNVGRSKHRGYSYEWSLLSYDLKGETMRRYVDVSRNRQPQCQRPHSRLEEYTADVLVSYFWQRAPKPLIEWSSRRYTVHFTNVSANLAITVALVVSGILVSQLGLGWTVANTIIVAIATVWAVMNWRNGDYARTEARQMIDLWMCRGLDPRMKDTLDRIDEDMLPRGQHSETVSESNSENDS